MTNEEAIKVLRVVLDPYDYPFGEKSKCYQYDLEAINQAIEALEKQIPKKPIIRKTEDYFGYVKYILCPNCKEVEFGFNQPCFCERCGQAIDWR